MMESAEHEMLRSLGISVLPKSVDGEDPISWPRVAANCDYQAAAHFEDLLQIDVSVSKIGTSSVSYLFQFSRDGSHVAKGTLTAVCCRLADSGLLKTAIPDDVRKLFEKHL
ncbi:1,4-dihydroxy-2-naphthoyl-CoA hydrolase [Rubripirellula tenax]|uniref:1,4-dihydroxy-2-naphthoyl-CoA hydrolase n=2 Tax=Rubripirellula tenax TaxID=2528015 RepID=A0A5C6EJ95_9BACT|nr:1,4-dihydroxy-2-naphthoyl-CoA hydrolase [Rubripirellula tenax]